MRRFLTSRIVEGLLAASLGYWLYWLVEPWQLRTEKFAVLAGVLWASWATLFIVATVSSWGALRDATTPLAGRVNVAGIWFASLGLNMLFGWSFVFQFLGSPYLLREHPFRGFALWVTAIGTIFILASAAFGDRQLLPVREWWRTAVLFSVLLVVTLAMVLATGSFH